MVPFSSTLGVAVRVTVVVSIESVMDVTAGSLLGTRFSKLPPVVPMMVVLTVLPLTWTSLAGVPTTTVPVVWPASMVMTEPLLKVTVIGVPAGLVRVAV
ncbi:hypothetical protein D3C76_896930 [compost metagenome]